jgi:hypothetical protein
MTTFNPGRWHHVLARQLQIKPSEALKLLRRGDLPDRSIRNESIPFDYDIDTIMRIESERSDFDTPVKPFAHDLRELAKLFLDGENESPPSKALVEFRQFNFGLNAGDCYPITRFVEPWRGHRVAISHAQLTDAGYRTFAEHWRAPDARRSIGDIGGEVPLGPYAWVYATHIRPDLRPMRAAFLARLADIVEAKS